MQRDGSSEIASFTDVALAMSSSHIAHHALSFLVHKTIIIFESWLW